MKKLLISLAGLLASGCLAQQVDLESLRLPEGFSISIYAELSGPRQMALGAADVVYGVVVRGMGSACGVMLGD